MCRHHQQSERLNRIGVRAQVRAEYPSLPEEIVQALDGYDSFIACFGYEATLSEFAFFEALGVRYESRWPLDEDEDYQTEHPWHHS
jgi:hypothetical protein